MRTISTIALFSLAIHGCPGRLTDPEDYVGGGPTTAPVTCSLSLSEVEPQLVRRRCATAGCHDAASRAGDLDLGSSGLSARLLAARSDACGDRPLIDTNSPAESYFLAKLSGAPACGAPMPLGAPALNPSERACVAQWVASLRPDAGTVMDVPAPRDVAADRPASDTATDRTVTDVLDARPDVPVDAVMDAAIDARPDVPADAAMDAIVDARTTDATADARDADDAATSDGAVDAADEARDAGDDATSDASDDGG